MNKLADHDSLLGGVRPEWRSRFTLGALRSDARLHPGLECGALHEVFAAGDDRAAAEAFALLLALRQPARVAPIFWVRDASAQRLHLYPQGLAELGVDPSAIILVDAGDAVGTLRAAADCLRCSGIAALIAVFRGNPKLFDLTASRRLALAAAASGVPAIAVRVDAEVRPSAAYSRWQVRPAPSTPLGANAPGHPAFDVTLLRHRGGAAPFSTRLEWDHARRCFDDAPLSRRAPAVAAGGATGAGERDAA
jgi:protein ImuA